MANTENLGIPLLSGSQLAGRSGINAALNHIDGAALPKAHKTSASHWQEWEKEKEYVVGDVIRIEGIFSWGYLECTTAGISGTVMPTEFYGEGDTRNDGTVVWTLRRIGKAVTMHGDLTGRNAANQHPLSAITGLPEALDSKMDNGDAYLKEETYSQEEVATLVFETVAPIAEVAHTHQNSAALAKVGETAEGNPAYGGQELAKKVDLHSHNNKAVLDKFTSEDGMPAYDGKLLVGGAQTWESSQAYQTNNLVVYDGFLYRCIAAHTASTAFDSTKWEQLSIGYIPTWAAGRNYHPGMVVTRGNSIYRCLVVHTSYAWDNVQRNYWEIIAGKGATLAEWQPNTDYSTGEAVIYNDILYYALSDHHSSGSFSSDMIAGTEKWKSIATAGSAGALRQVTYLGVEASTIKDIVVPWSDTFLTPPVECLKFVPGLQDQVYTACVFDNADADDFMIDGDSGELSPWIIFDGTMRPRKSYTLSFSLPVVLGAGKESVSDWVDHSVYKSITSITVK